MIKSSFLTKTQKNQKTINLHLEKILKKQKIMPSLLTALSYALLAPGKRIRPNLVLLTHQLVAQLLHKKSHLSQEILNLGAAIECIHTYSLIHDDLPAMDDDSLRRGRETLHIKFNEATAILAGDALLSFAFEILSELKKPNLNKVINLIAKASGALGMVGGQFLDLEAEGKNISLQQLTKLHSLKTGKMIEAAVLSVVYFHSLEKHKPIYKKHFQTYGAAIGLCFQVVDDILDITQPSTKLGKNAGSDLKKNKSTFVRLLGLTGAKNKAKKLNLEAKEALKKIKQIYLKEENKSRKTWNNEPTQAPEINHLSHLADMILNRVK